MSEDKLVSVKTPEQERIDKLEGALRLVHEENQKLQVIYHAASAVVRAHGFGKFRKAMKTLGQKIKHYEDSKK